MTALAAAPSDLTLATAMAIVRDAARDQTFLTLPMGRHVGRYLRAKRKALTASSYIGYESCLEKLARQFGDLDLEHLELPHGADLIETWMDERWGESAPGTYNVNHSILSDFFDWQVKHQRMRSNPMRVVGRAKKRQVYRTTYSEDQCRALLANAVDLRDRIALRLLIFHGLRKDALRNVQIKHFDYGRHRLTIFTKGGKVKPVPIPEAAFWTDLERYVLETEATPDDWLMCLVKPIPRAGVRRFPSRQLSKTALHRWWYRRLEDAGIVPVGQTGGSRMHAMRHTAGQRVLDRTGDVKLTQKFLGHESIQTTADIYVDYDIDTVAARLVDVLRDEED